MIYILDRKKCVRYCCCAQRLFGLANTHTSAPIRESKTMTCPPFETWEDFFPIIIIIVKLRFAKRLRAMNEAYKPVSI